MDKQLKRYLLMCSVKSAEGNQIYYVDAENEAEAVKTYNQGGGELYSEEIEVQDLEPPEVIGTTDLDDFGEFDSQSNSISQQVEAAQWVSMTERFPEEGEVIFATGPKYNDYAKYGRYYATVQFINGVFYDEETGDDIYPPSHWMRIVPVPDSALSSPAEQKGNVND